MGYFQDEELKCEKSIQYSRQDVAPKPNYLCLEKLPLMLNDGLAEILFTTIKHIYSLIRLYGSLLNDDPDVLNDKQEAQRPKIIGTLNVEHPVFARLMS